MPLLSAKEIGTAEQAFMESGAWELGNFEFASGATANNHLDGVRPLDLKNYERLSDIINPLGKLVLAHNPDVLWGVETGGRRYAEVLGSELELPVVYLDKDINEPGFKTYEFRSDKDEELALNAERMVGLEDITTRLTSIAGALTNPILKDNTVAMVALFRRGLAGKERKIPKPIYWVIQRHVPNIISKDDPFYRQYAHLAREKKEP